MRNSPLLIALLTLSGLAVQACSGASLSSVNIGLVPELTGDIPAVGASCKNAAEMAAAEINSAGGLDIGGKKFKVELVVEDNAASADRSVSAIQKLVTQDNVTAIIGPNSSSYAIPASEAAETARVPLISPWSTKPKTTLDARTGDPKKYVFRAGFIDSFQGRVVAKFSLDTLKAKKAAVLYDVTSDYNRDIADIFKKTFQDGGGRVVAFETYAKNDKDFTEQMGRIKASAPDLVYLPNYYTEVPPQIQQAKRLGVTAPFLGSDSWGGGDLLKLCGNDCEGYYFTTHYAPDSATPAARRFVEAYKARYNATPDDVAALTYDSFGLVTQALQSAGKIDRQSVRDALANIASYEGVTGTMQFKDGSGDPIKSAVVVQIKEGKIVWHANASP